MDARNLADIFEVDEPTVETWLGQGMPLDPERAEEWLVDHGYAGYEDDEADVAPGEGDSFRSLRDIAKATGYSAAALTQHSRKPDFPPGPPFDRRAVLDWYQQHAEKKETSKTTTPKEPTAREERDRVKLELERLKLEKERGEVLSLEQVIAEMTRQHSLAVQKLKGLTNLLVALLPPDTPALILEDFRSRARKVIADACDDIATAFRGEVDDDLD